MLIPAYVYLRCEKCGADHGRFRFPLPTESLWYERLYEPGEHRIFQHEDLEETPCKACGRGLVLTFFETDEFRAQQKEKNNER